MARIPSPDPFRYEGQPLAERIRRERGGQLLNLYRMLLHSPPVTEGWLAFLTAIRHETELPGRYRELAILRVAVLNGAEYEFEAHVPFALKAGVSREAIDALRANCATSEGRSRRRSGSPPVRRMRSTPISPNRSVSCAVSSNDSTSSRGSQTYSSSGMQ